MGLGREMDDGIRILHRRVHRRPIADVALDEGEARMALDVRQRLTPAGIGELVEYDDRIFGMLRQDQPDIVGTDEAGAARHEDPHRNPSQHPTSGPTRG